METRLKSEIEKRVVRDPEVPSGARRRRGELREEPQALGEAGVPRLRGLDVAANEARASSRRSRTAHLAAERRSAENVLEKSRRARTYPFEKAAGDACAGPAQFCRAVPAVRRRSA